MSRYVLSGECTECHEPLILQWTCYAGPTGLRHVSCSYFKQVRESLPEDMFVWGELDAKGDLLR